MKLIYRPVACGPAVSPGGFAAQIGRTNNPSLSYHPRANSYRLY